ncbi:MAG: ABC transporter substrate-binding protein [Alphaproteobacteria bacterium]|nr:MAG: ABC transporter substrate-binding protein [Alphaproteobacteria bacterium]
MFRKTITGAICLLAVETFAAGPAAAEAVFRISHQLEGGGAESMDPYDTNRFWPPINMVYNRLVYAGPDGLPLPELATAWHAENGERAWIFTLQEGVTFSDGSAFDAVDVAYSIMRMIDPELDSPLRPVLENIERVEVVDPLTVRIVTKAPDADLPVLLTDYRALMIPEGSGETIDENPVGTGPFKVETIEPEGTSVLVANPDYFRGKPGVDRVEVIAITDSVARVQALQAGQIDYIDNIDPKQLALFSDTSRFTTQKIETGEWEALIMRTDTSPYDDPRVRKALRIAADRESIIKVVLGEGGGHVACDNPVWQGDPYHWDGQCGQDIEGARKLLAEAGYPDGIDVQVFTSDVVDTYVSLVEAYQEQVKDAGIRVELVMTAADGYWNDVWMVEPFFVTGWGQRPAAQILPEAFRSGAAWNESYYANPEFDALLDRARSEPDFDKRKALYVEAQQMLFEDGGAFIPYFRSVARVFRANVKGVDPVISDSVRWEAITVD